MVERAGLLEGVSDSLWCAALLCGLCGLWDWRELPNLGKERLTARPCHISRALQPGGARRGVGVARKSSLCASRRAWRPFLVEKSRGRLRTRASGNGAAMRSISIYPIATRPSCSQWARLDLGPSKTSATANARIGNDRTKARG